ncbi:MAG: oligosaccharide flippase family protein [Azonexus sp.]
MRNVLTVASGTALSQIVAIAFSPLLTRLYGPEAFGLQGIFLSAGGLAATIAAMGYPTAIVLPKNDADAKLIVLLSIFIGLTTSLLIAATLILWGDGILALLNAKEIAGFMFLIPFAMLFSVFSAVLGQWLIRKKAYKLSARYGVLSTVLLNSIKTCLGFIQPTAFVLIATNTFGSALYPALAYLGWTKEEKCVAGTQLKSSSRRKTVAKLLRLAKRYRDFPILRTPQNLINSLSQALPMLLLASFFGPASAGHYGIALAVLGIPASLIGSSVMSVFYPKVTESINNKEDARSLIVRATIGMAATGAFPFVVILFAGPFLFALIFGAEWRNAGIYAQILSPWLFLQFINKPAVSAIPSLGLQGGLLVYELFSTGTKIFALWVGFSVFKSDTAAIGIFSLVGIIAYLWLILWVITRSRNLPISDNGY